MEAELRDHIRREIDRLARVDLPEDLRVGVPFRTGHRDTAPDPLTPDGIGMLAFATMHPNGFSRRRGREMRGMHRDNRAALYIQGTDN